MGVPAAKQDDTVIGVDTHIVVVPAVGPMPLPHLFSGRLSGSLSRDVTIAGKPAATVGSTATNQPAHVPTPPGTAFSKPPANQGTVQMGSPTVRINGKAAARTGDPVMTCNDPVDAPTGTIVAAGTVMIG